MNSVAVFFYASTTDRELCDHKPQPPDLPGVDGSALGGVNAGGLDAAVAQDVCQAGEVLFQAVIRPGEQVPEIVGEYLAGSHPGALTQGLHVPPDIGPVQRPAVLGHKHRSGGDFLFLEIGFQQAAQLVRQEYHPPLALVAHLCPARLDGLHGYEFQFADPDARGADGLDHQGQALVLLFLRRPHQPDILLPGELFFLVEEQRPLDFEGPQAQIPSPQVGQQAVHRRQHGIDAGRGMGGDEAFLPFQQQTLCDGLFPQPLGQGGNVMGVLLDGLGSSLQAPQMAGIAVDQIGG